MPSQDLSWLFESHLGSLIFEPPPRPAPLFAGWSRRDRAIKLADPDPDPDLDSNPDPDPDPDLASNERTERSERN